MDQNARIEAAVKDRRNIAAIARKWNTVRETLSKRFLDETSSTRDVDSYVRQQPTNVQEDTLTAT
jgi:hypothetical protein